MDRWPAAGLGVLLALFACGPKGPSDAETAARAQAAIGPFKKSLKNALLAELAKSPASAIDVCAETAPALAREASKEGVRVGRASAKLRNPANAPPGWLAPVMAELSRAPSGTAASRVVDLGDGRRGYAEAIWLEAPCLLCHGAEIVPEVQAKITERYPQDAARGFQVGDFRGVFWAEIDAPAR
jgi:hypothetical protein